MTSETEDDCNYVYDEEEDDDEYEYSDTDTNSQINFSPIAKKSRHSIDFMNKKNTFKTSSSRIISSTELAIQQENLIKEISLLLNLDISVTDILLRHFMWNKEKLLEQYCIDPEKTKMDAGVQYLENFILKSNKIQDTKVECPICQEEYMSSEASSIGCCHLFCNNCWKPYLSFKVSEGPSCIFTTCPAHGCQEIVPKNVFKKFISDECYKKYKKYLLNSFVDINKNLKWCPGVSCENAIYCSMLDDTSTNNSPSVKCPCGCYFCVKCGEEGHLPISCHALILWNEKCRNESETANWILANTKKCPKCVVRIEKHQGCNHMTCRHCKYEFCWICSGPWTEHNANTGGYYKCNRYDAGTPSKPTGNSEHELVAKAKAELDRYLHYYQRFANHHHAQKIAIKMLKNNDKKMMDLTSHISSNMNNAWIDVQFLNNANELLIECRRVLKYTYIFAFYCDNPTEKSLFEYLQENLEKNTEHLTELIEKPVDQINRAEIINYTRVTGNFLNNLLTGVEDGLTSLSHDT